MISIDDFKKIELKVGKVVEAELVEGSEKLIKLKIDLGEETLRQVLTGMKQWYEPVTFVDQQVVIVANLEPRMIFGLESQGMIVAVDGSDGQPVLLKPAEDVPQGSKAR